MRYFSFFRASFLCASFELLALISHSVILLLCILWAFSPSPYFSILLLCIFQALNLKPTFKHFALVYLPNSFALSMLLSIFALVLLPGFLPLNIFRVFLLSYVFQVLSPNFSSKLLGSWSASGLFSPSYSSKCFCFVIFRSLFPLSVIRAFLL